MEDKPSVAPREAEKPTRRPRPRHERPRRHELTNTERAKITTLYEQEGVGVTEIARRLKRDVKTVQKVTSALTRGSRAEEVQRAVDERLAEQAAESVAETVRRAQEAKDDSFRISTLIHKLIGKTIVECQRNRQPLSSIVNDIKVLKEAALAAKVAREERYAVLGIKESEDEDDELPGFTVAELTQDEIIEMKAQQRAESGLDDPDGIEVGEVEVHLNGSD